MITVGKQAPFFRCNAVINGKVSTLTLDELRGRYTVLFFYPLNFTFVCPTELHAFQEVLSEFTARNCQVVGVSVDSVYSHLAWLATPRAKGGIEGITYPLVSDINKIMSRDYGVLIDEQGIALRGLFLLDKETVIQHVTINNLALGRNVCEVLRLVDALQHVEQYGEVCPANWSSGKPAMTATTQGVCDYLSDEKR